MTFDEVLDQIRELVQSKGRVAYGALKRRFDLDDAYLEDLKAELIDAEQVARDEDGKVLVWTGASPVQSSEFQVPSSQASNRQLETRNVPPFSQDSGLRTQHLSAERRQLTVMFCDVVGSTALSERLDPEDLRTVMQAYQQACVAVITRFDGYVAKYLGDGLLVYFGYPLAHEDDAPRAVRAGLGIVEAMQNLPLSQLQLPSPLQVRVGVHTGLVVAGEMGSGEYREERAIVGETPNIAARLQEKALPNSVVISPTTYRLVTGLFDCQELGPHVLKGISNLLALYQVVRESAAQSRFEAAVQTGLTPLVGRADELHLLHSRWAQVQDGAGQVVLLSGEPGIGKSRLVQAFKDHVVHDGALRLEFRCSPYYHNTALHPIIEHLQRLLQFARTDTAESKLTKLHQLLAQYRFPQADTLPLLAALLSLPLPAGTPPLTATPQKQKQRTLEAFVAWMSEEAERAAVYCAFEDLHWADPSTLEFLEVVLAQVPTTRVLVLLTFRPEFQPPWGGRSYLSPLTLSRLGRQQSAALITRVTGGKPLPAAVVEQIVTKTDGVPLFIEELTKMVLESGLLRAVNGHYELSGPLPPLAIPSTLQDSLTARLDRLAPVREVAQLGATIGREFSYELIRAVGVVAEERLHQGLKQLVEAELLYRRGLPPAATYLFKHALVQDVAYQSLLKSTRQQYHQQIAQILEERFPDTTETQPELLAHHCTEARLIVQAIPYWQKAGERAIQRSANVEAVSHLTKGLELLKTLPDTPERIQHELTLQITLGAPLTATKGYAAPEVGQVYTRAHELCRQLGETPQLIPVLFGLWRFYLQRAELQTARELGEECLSLAQRLHDPVRLLRAHNTLGVTLFYLAELHAAREHLEQGIALYSPQQHSLAVVQDPMVACLSYMAWVLWYLGYPDQALKRSHEALTLAQELSHPYSVAQALFFATELHHLRQEVQAVQERAEAVITLAAEQGFPFWSAQGTSLRGWALVKQGQREEGITQIRQGLAVYQSTGAELGRPYYLAELAEACGLAGQAEEGLRVLAEALTAVYKSGEFSETEICRLKGELTLKRSGVRGPELEVQREAEECFQKAIEIARRQNAKSLELRAVTSLSRLWQQQGKKTEAHKLLLDVYNWFTEGFDTKDLQEAKALLEELSH